MIVEPVVDGLTGRTKKITLESVSFADETILSAIHELLSNMNPKDALKVKVDGEMTVWRPIRKSKQ